MSTLVIKICGLTTEESVECAVEAGADMVGFVFHPKSPRNVSLQRAAELGSIARGKAQVVALVVDAQDEALTKLRAALINNEMRPDLFQFHGQESPERVQAVREHFNIPIMKALGVASRDDLAAIPAYAAVADHLLLDAKPPKDAAYPGGHGRPFDWKILSALPPTLPFMLSGGLTLENVGEAIRMIRSMGLNLIGVDVSSGVESAPGVKDLEKIKAFIANAREAD